MLDRAKCNSTLMECIRPGGEVWLYEFKMETNKQSSKLSRHSKLNHFKAFKNAQIDR